MAEVEILASPASHGRGAATPDEQRAAHLAQQLERAGVEPLGNSPLRMQAFSFGSSMSQNVLGVIRPAGDPPVSPSSIIVLGAHSDHLGVTAGELYPGADDLLQLLGVQR